MVDGASSSWTVASDGSFASGLTLAAVGDVDLFVPLFDVWASPTKVLLSAAFLRHLNGAIIARDGSRDVCIMTEDGDRDGQGLASLVQRKRRPVWELWVDFQNIKEGWVVLQFLSVESVFYPITLKRII